MEARSKPAGTTEGGRFTELAEAVRRACLEAAQRAHEDAGLRGLCMAGRWEAAVGAVLALDLRAVIEGARRGS